MQTNIFFLTGFMASGKTSFGRKAAAKLGASFWDLDEYLVQVQGPSIAEIFAQEGEATFRQLEHETLLQFIAFLQEKDGLHLVACGGGTPCFFDNLALMKAAGKMLYLQHDFPILLGRLRVLQPTRPMLAHLSPEELSQFIENLLTQREPYYLQADCIINSPNVPRLCAAIQPYLS
ncbi:MAG: shikimate kinase [Bacteroidia bacterium]